MKVRWENVKGPKAIIALIISTALGAGLFPFGPGTMGTLVAIPIAYFTCGWSWIARLALWAGLTVVGTWAAKTFDELMKSNDNQNIVIDEVVGYGITSWTIGTSGHGIIAAFLLFRFFDILKPWPVRSVDRWSKKKSKGGGELAKWKGGFGVIADDILAGFQGLIVILILQYFQLLPS